MTYEEFLKSKKHSSIDFGIKTNFMPEKMFDFQKYVAEYAIKKGRCAVFLDTGLGKTIIELTIAHNYVKDTNKKVLIITPLAVAQQHVKEAEKFDIPGVYHSKQGELKGDIILCNYERLDKFNSIDFDCVILDESSILKNFDGAIKQQVTKFLKKVKYRFLATATPSPNDFIELGTSSEALGYIGYMEMLQKFFANNENNIRPQEIASKWYLKPHAIDDFFKWVSSWSISMRKPSDLGFDDSRFILPELIKKYNYVKNNKNWVVDNQIMMFGKIAKTMTEVKQEQQMTITERCEKAVELAASHETSVYWCNFNYESDLIKQLDKDSCEIRGSMDLDKKEDILINFSNGSIKKIITKPRITAFGLNWQHCNHTVFFPTWSYEQYYQAIRRFWRFGQTKTVLCDLVLSDGQQRVIDALELKTEKAIELFDRLNSHLNAHIEFKKESFTKQINLPTWM